MAFLTPVWREAGVVTSDVDERRNPLHNIGKIERTFHQSTVIDVSNPDWNIEDDKLGCSTNECAWLLVGDVVEKVGVTTGWTTGKIDRTCEYVVADGWPSGTLLLCQDWVKTLDGSVIAEGGDSGAPVFELTGGFGVELYGILGGGIESGTEYFYSRVDNVRNEIGFFSAIGPITPQSVSPRQLTERR